MTNQVGAKVRPFPYSFSGGAGSEDDVSCSMEHCKHVDLIGFDVIDDTIRPFNDLADLFHLILRHRFVETAGSIDLPCV